MANKSKSKPPPIEFHRRCKRVKSGITQGRKFWLSRCGRYRIVLSDGIDGIKLPPRWFAEVASLTPTVATAGKSSLDTAFAPPPRGQFNITTKHERNNFIMPTEQTKQAARTCAQAFIDQEYKYQRERNAERFAAATDEQKQEFEDRQHSAALSLATAIVDKCDPFITRANQGLLHPSNKNSRQLFMDVTGLTLPKTVSGTDDSIEKYAGEQLKALRDAKQAEIDRKEAEAKAKQESADKKFLDKMRPLFADDEMIDGSDVRRTAKLLGIDVHPRTINYLETKVVEVCSHKSRTYGKSRTGTHYEVYRRCCEVFAEEWAEEQKRERDADQVAQCDALFTRKGMKLP